MTTSQTDVVVQGVREMIRSRRLGPGSRLPIERDLAEELGVSRGSLREGVRALCIMGVLETRQGDGTYVTSLDAQLLLAPMSFMVDLQAPEHRDDLHVVRRVLETEAAARAARLIDDAALDEAEAVLEGVSELVAGGRDADHERILDADIAFHRIIAHASGNAALASLIDALADRTSRARLWLGLQHHGQIETAHSDHRAILAALRAHDPDRARHMMDHHLLVVEDRLHDAGDDAPAPTDRAATDQAATDAQ
ncbi:FadR/GntR family transcriptional regulator [Pseudolysinimonas sp.]|uniref:FadR/GntR family transcriptional regulator n=1 Tax=Pseudolysinimonas sp. TaxID=2680009 RepID=UPI003F7D4787